MSDLTFVELFAGVGGMSMGFEMAGWRCVGHAEWDTFPRRVLKHRWPDVPLWGDVSMLNGQDIVSQVGPFTMLTFGAPCQDFSIAGKREGMDGQRSVLVLDALRIWEESQAPFALYENVVGMLSSNQGADFAGILSAFVGSDVAVPARGWRGGGGVVEGRRGIAAWRVLDAQYFGVPQRRRRVFVLGTRTRGVNPAEVLSLAESLSGNSQTRRKARQSVASDAGTGIDQSIGCLTPWDYQGKRVFGPESTWPTLYSASNSGQQQQSVLAIDVYNQSVSPNGVAHTIRAGNTGEGVPHTMAFHQTQRPISEIELSPALGTTSAGMGIVSEPVVLRNREGKPGGGKGPLVSEGKRLTLGTTNDQVVFTQQRDAEYAKLGIASTFSARDYKEATDLAIGYVGIPRRLTPVECERLMGWPDGWTDVPDEKGKPATDTARYKACGNGVASPVAAWIGFRLRDALTNRLLNANVDPTPEA
jgi:DNA (cytosine-5)-methyltransferase 1